MAEIIVTTLKDVVDPSDGFLSLREAVETANNSVEEDVIRFGFAPVAGRYADRVIVLSGTDISITSDLTIDGDIDGDGDADVRIDARYNSRAFSISPNGADVELNGLELTNGRAENGGAIWLGKGNSLTISNSEFSNNSSYSKGGAIYNEGSRLGISDTFFIGNSAGYLLTNPSGSGGGIFQLDGSLHLYGSTFSSNRAKGDGGGLFLNGSSNLANVTFFGNRANSATGSGGAVYNSGDLTGAHLTLVQNSAAYGGGIKTGPLEAGGAGIVANSLFLANEGAVSDPDIHGAFSGGTPGTYFGTDPEVVFIDPQGYSFTLGLTNRSGPVPTFDVRPEADNPILDYAVPIAGIATDATGLSRVVDVVGVDNGGTADAGANEVQALREKPSLVVTTTADVVDAFDGQTSLREALELANQNSDHDNITFAAGPGEAFEKGGRIVLSGTPLSASGSVKLDGDVNGDGTPDVVLDGDNLSRVLNSGGDVHIHGLVISNGSESFRGGGINQGGNLTISNSFITDNSARSSGGAIYGRGSISIIASEIVGNSSRSGAAIHSPGDIKIVDSYFGANSGYFGGAINSDGIGSLSITGSAFANNKASMGGAIYNVQGNMRVENSTFVGNETGIAAGPGFGGAILSVNRFGTGGNLDLINSTVTGNIAGVGGGIRAGGVTHIENSIVAGNVSVPGSNDAAIPADATIISSIIGVDAAQVFETIDPLTGGGVLASSGGERFVGLLADPGNPALDIGTLPTGVTQDAIGNPRNIDIPDVDNGGTVDAGAVELQSLSSVRPGGNPMNGTARADELRGTQANELIRGRAGDDTIRALDGGDTVFGDRGSDQLFGGDGDDFLKGGAGDDRADGRDGDDDLSGGSGDDSLFGGSGSDTIKGDSGSDRIDGQGGNDLASGGGGNDLILGGRGSDTVSGGGGNDTLSGGAGDDALAGDGGNDQISGGSGSDTISGGSGSDTIVGGAASDVLNGGSGNDLIQGGSGSDTLVSGAGSDTLEGQYGADVFRFGTEASNGVQERDVIVDYQPGDTIELLGVDIVEHQTIDADLALTLTGSDGDLIILEGIAALSDVTWVVA